MSSPTFIHLRAHSSYSLSEGAIQVKDLVKLAVKHHMPAIALTDAGNLFASLEFSSAAVDAGVQPIIGCVLSVSEGSFVLLAKDKAGYQNLLNLTSLYYQEGQSPRSTLSWEELEAHTEGLIMLSGGAGGLVGQALVQGQKEAARQLLERLKGLFPDRLYIEISRHGMEEEAQTEAAFLEFAYQMNLPLVATNDVYFATSDMYDAHDALICINDGRYIAEENRRRFTPEHYLKSAEAMAELFADIPEAIANTVVIAKRSSVMSKSHPPILPNFPTEQGRTQEEELCVLAETGLIKRLGSDDKIKFDEYFERLAFELSVINRMQYAGYFLIVSDFMRWGKSQGIPLGPGRGSGAGSVVAWALEITNLDPLRFGLLFERFLNPERVSMPDFDIDFCQERRDEVIKYVQQKYGQDRVAQIITFGKLQARAVLRDVGRVLQLPYGQVDKICKMIPFNPIDPITLSKAIAMDTELQRERDKDPNVAMLLDMGLKLEGLHRHASTHAAGVVIADRPLTQLVPLYFDPRSAMPVTQYDMKQAEKAGLVKFDFLGLKTLTQISRTCELVRAKGIEIDIDALPFDDKPTYALLSKGDASGVFQMESAGMRDALRKLKPDTIEDIIALISLYRPGPMENIPSYIARKHGREKPNYLHPLLEPCLKETFGVIIYQEQVMEIAKVLAGYSLGKADLLRRAMGKKIKAEMDAQREMFVSGAVENSVDKKQASDIFDLVAKFAGYGFNKSHAAAYAVIGYQTAYLKANYPVEFYTAAMNMDIGDSDKINMFRQEALTSGIQLLPPDINLSDAYFLPEGEAIRYGLGAIKGVGLAAMQELALVRGDKPFSDIFDIAERLDSKIVNKRQMENLARAGAFDAIEPNRKKIFENAPLLARFNSTVQEEKESQQESLFSGGGESEITRPALKECEDWQKADRMREEFEALGFYLSAHPLDAYATVLANTNIANSKNLNDKLSAKAELKMAGVAVAVTHRATAGKRFAYIQFSDPQGLVEISVFDEKLISDCRTHLESTLPLMITVDARKDEGGVRLIAKKVAFLDEALNNAVNFAAPVMPSELTIIMQGMKALEAIKKSLSAANAANHSHLKLRLQTEAYEEVEISLPKSLTLTPAMLSELEQTDGIAKILAD